MNSLFHSISYYGWHFAGYWEGMVVEVETGHICFLVLCHTSNPSFIVVLFISWVHVYYVYWAVTSGNQGHGWMLGALFSPLGCSVSTPFLAALKYSLTGRITNSDLAFLSINGDRSWIIIIVAFGELVLIVQQVVILACEVGKLGNIWDMTKERGYFSCLIVLEYSWVLVL